MTRHDITVIVPTRNERHNIGRFLESLPTDVPLIVIDASDDDTADCVRKIRPEQTLIVSERSNIPVARQRGAELARTVWLVYADADVALDPEYFDCLTRYGESDVVYGPKLSLDKYQDYYTRFTKVQRFMHGIQAPIASGSNLAIRREVLLRCGGFDPDLLCNEDTELVWRVHRGGFRIAFAEDLRVYAFDHRRLERGRVRKTLHSLIRGFLIYFELLPSVWRRNDWGYWSSDRQQGDKSKRPA